MDEQDLCLEDWVAVRKDVFVPTSLGSHTKFLVAWNEDLNKAAVTMLDRSRQASDSWSNTETGLFSIQELFYTHQQLALLHTEIKFPEQLKTSLSKTFFKRASKLEPHTASSLVQKYLSTALPICGKNVLQGILFQKGEIFANYEESITELKHRGYEGELEKATKELDEVLSLRQRCETMLEMVSVYSVEDEAVAKLLTAMGNIYNFQLWQFLEEREFAQAKVDEAMEQLRTREIGERIRQNLQSKLDQWKEQFISADEAIQQLYEEYYRKTWKILLEQRNRMQNDQSVFGKAAYSLNGLERFQMLDVKVCQEHLKLLHVNKATRETQRDRIVESRRNVFSKKDHLAIDEEIYEANMNCLNLGLEILEQEESLLKKKVVFLQRKFQDLEEEGIFFDAQESAEDCQCLDDIEDLAKTNPELQKLKKQLNSVFRKRAALRNKKKALIADHKLKSKNKEAEVTQRQKHHSIQIKRVEREKEEKNLKELREMEKQKTLQRLKEYRKKYVKAEKNEGGEEVEHHELPPPPLEWLQETWTPSSNNEATKPEVHTLPATQCDSFLLPPPSNIPPPLPPPPPSIPPPPPPPSSIPPPPPMLNFNNFNPETSKPLNPVKNIDKPSSSKGVPPSIGLSDIIAARSKLKKHEDGDGASNYRKLPLPQDGNLESILRSVVSRIRVSVSDTDSDHSQDSNDFD